jgi:hypothetical protein
MIFFAIPIKKSNQTLNINPFSYLLFLSPLFLEFFATKYFWAFWVQKDKTKGKYIKIKLMHEYHTKREGRLEVMRKRVNCRENKGWGRREGGRGEEEGKNGGENIVERCGTFWVINVAFVTPYQRSGLRGSKPCCFAKLSKNRFLFPKSLQKNLKI